MPALAVVPGDRLRNLCPGLQVEALKIQVGKPSIRNKSAYMSTAMDGIEAGDWTADNWWEYQASMLGDEEEA